MTGPARFLPKFLIATSLLLAAPALVSASGLAGEQSATSDSELSPPLRALLQAEMVELAGGLQLLAPALATADWKTLEDTSHKMHASYILKKSLTKTQAMELQQKLPHGFKQLDAAFHARAKKLAEAAAARDAELALFHYSRLVENCVACHSAFATNRFPGFANRPQQPHKH